jgi:hypothetical protein
MVMDKKLLSTIKWNGCFILSSCSRGKGKKISSDNGSEFVGSKCKGASSSVHPQEEGRPFVRGSY